MSGRPFDEWQSALEGIGVSQESAASSGIAWRRELEGLGASQASHASATSADWRAALSQECSAIDVVDSDDESSPTMPVAGGGASFSQAGAIVVAEEPELIGDVVEHNSGDPEGRRSGRVPALELLARNSRTMPDEDLHQSTYAVAGHFLFHKKGVASVTAEAKQLGADRKFLQEVRTLTAAACLHVERQAWSKLEADLVASTPRVVEGHPHVLGW